MAVRAETQIDLARVDDGSPGTPGQNGATFTPSVAADGDISWTNDGGLPNPPTQNIMGPAGPSAPTITDVKTQYYLSTSSASPTGGSWSDTPQEFVSGQFYWTKDYTTYSDGTHTESTPVYNQGLTLANEYALTANDAAAIAYNSASQAISQLSVVEDIVGVLNMISTNGYYAITEDDKPIQSKWYFSVTGTAVTPDGTENPHEMGWYELDNGVYSLTEDTTVQVGTTYYTITAQAVSVGYDYILTSDSTIVSGKTYYTRSGSGTELDPYVYTEVQTPVQADLGIYYEYTNSPELFGYYELVGIDESIQNYVSSHLVLAGDSLFLQTDEGNGSTRLELNTTTGLTLYDQNGNPVASYGSNVVIGDANGFHVQVTNNRLSFYRDSVNEVAYVSGDKLYITQSVVLQQMDIGTPVADGGFGQWSWCVHTINGQNNLYLKWLG